MQCAVNQKVFDTWKCTGIQLDSMMAAQLRFPTRILRKGYVRVFAQSPVIVEFVFDVLIEQ